MNLKSFLLGLFRGVSANGELKKVEEAGRQDARLFVGTYLNSFEAEAAKLFTERQQRFVGFAEEPEPEPKAIEAKATKKPATKSRRKAASRS